MRTPRIMSSSPLRGITTPVPVAAASAPLPRPVEVRPAHRGIAASATRRYQPVHQVSRTGAMNPRG